jgi:ferritin
MPAAAFVDRLNEQVGHEFAAHQQYVDVRRPTTAGETGRSWPLLLSARRSRSADHAMMMVRYCSTRTRRGDPRRRAPAVGFSDVVAPVALALAQERA